MMPMEMVTACRTGLESVAGTDPTDPNARLAFVTATRSLGSPAVGWRARGGKTYVLRSTGNANLPYSTVLFSNNVAGGAGAWLVTTNFVTDTSTTNAEFYSVEVVP